MHSKRDVHKRSVAIQSSELCNTEAGPQPGRLCKKAAFRNLVQKSVSIIPQGSDLINETFSFHGGKNSKSVQACLDAEPGFYNTRYRLPGSHTIDFPASKRCSLSKEEEGDSPGSDMVKDVEKGLESPYPGTSRMPSNAHSSFSFLTQANEAGLSERPREESLAIVYSYGDKNLASPKSSNFGYHFGSQESRRFSDETVLLIEDYQSYDYSNTAGRQDMDFSLTRNLVTCCNRNKRYSHEMLTRPVTIEYEEHQEREDALVCRICHEGEDVEPLIQPCLCKGSVGNVHASCLKTWLEQSNTSRCELCNYPYAIRQTRKYPKCLSVKVFFQTVVDRRALTYDVISFVIITPLTLVGVAMCIQASVFSTTGDLSTDANYQMGNITKAGMIMLSGTIVVAYGVWLYTLISYHYKAWKKWYSNCYDVEVIPVRLTSEERLEAARMLSREFSRRQISREQGPALISVLHSPNPATLSFFQRRLSLGAQVHIGNAFDHRRY